MECDVEFKSGLESLKLDAKRYQGILLVRELVLAYPPRLFLHSNTFFENIHLAICDTNSQIRYEAIELFRISLIICFNREASNRQNAANNESRTTGSSSGNANNGTGTISGSRIRRTSTTSSFNSTISGSDNTLNNLSSSLNGGGSPSSNLNQLSSLFASTLPPSTASNDNDLEQFKKCFEKSISELRNLTKDYTVQVTLSSAKSIQSLSGGGLQQPSKDDQIHGHLLVILEMVKFSCLDFEEKIENYLSTYNLYYQELEQSLNNLTTSLNSSSASFYNLTNGIENTARTCEEMHSINLLKLLPDSSFDPFHSNDQFTFLFKSDKIKVSVESQLCKQLINEKFDQILKLCLTILKRLNLVNLNQSMTGVASSSSSITASIPSLRCILDTILELMPRLANFNPVKFSSFYLKEVLQFLTTLNSNTHFLIPGSTGGGLANSSSNINLATVSGFGSSRFHIRQNSTVGLNPNLSSSSVNNANSSSSSSSASYNSGSVNLVPSNASFCFGTLKSQVIFCVGFMSLSLSSTKNEDFSGYTKHFLELIRTSPLLMNRELLESRNVNLFERKGQINELNSIMACIAMLSNSINNEQKTKLNLVESIMSLLEGNYF